MTDKVALLRQTVRKALTPPPRISVVEWADRYRKLAKEAGSTSGNWETATVEIARGPMLAVTEPGVHIITAMVCTQLMKTALLENTFGYFADLDPCPILLLQPKEDAAEQFSKERIAPLIRVTPVLRQLITTTKTRESDNTLLYKAFPGGFLAMAGAGSPDNLARRPVRVILADEIDKYPVTREGDPIALAEERTATFGVNWLSVRACSPTVTDESRIESSYQDSDQRRASVVCPHCRHRQFLDFFKHVHWDKTEDGRHLPKTAKVYCECCGTGWSEGERLRALQTIQWHQTKPFTCCGQRHVPLDIYQRSWKDEGVADPVSKAWAWWQSDRYAVHRAVCPDCGLLGVENDHAGFQAGKLYSPWQKDKPSDQAAKWLKAKDDEDKKQTFYNTQLGITYRPFSGKELSREGIAARGEVWPAEIPDGVAVLTVGGDTQDDRVELEVVGWGRNEESWSIAYEVIEGDPNTVELWERVDEFLKRIWLRADGMGFEVRAACIDSGGHHTQKVYEFCKARLGRKIWAIKGESARSGQRSPVWPTKRPTRRTKSGYRPIVLGVNAAKDTIRARLAKEKPGDGYMHFPADRDINYYEQLLSERSVLKVVNGQKFRVWELPAGKTNEALDCRVYAYGALCGLFHMGFKLNKRADEVNAAVTATSSELSEAEAADVSAAAEQPIAAPEPAKPAVAVSPPVAPVPAKKPPAKKSLISRMA